MRIHHGHQYLRRVTVSNDFTVQGRKVYLECHGTGSPTIVLQSGYGNGGDIWNATTAQPPSVATGLAATKQGCVYDRPGATLVLAALIVAPPPVT